MDNIARIHGKILTHLLKIREMNPEFYFAPRKINNQKRLEKGYWFIGNSNYLIVSFWNGVDWKERVHHIGLTVLPDGTSYIEFSAQDSHEKAAHLAVLASNVSGFEKARNKNKWFKHYSGKDYIKNLDNFISNFKPIVDEFINENNFDWLMELDEAYFTKYGKRVIEIRNHHIQFGKKNKISRICWNGENQWKFPSGSHGKSDTKGLHEADYGFGLEEWLFNRSRQIDGYHYSFLQPLSVKSNKHDEKKYNISLYTRNNLNKRYLVGEIKNVECISKEESERIFELYIRKGWHREMREDIQRIGGVVKKFDSLKPNDFFNIRFKLSDVNQFEELVELANDDVNITVPRYKLLSRKTDFTLTYTAELDEDEGKRKNTKTRKRVFNVESEYDPYHDKMQNAIVDLLKTSQKYQYKKVFIEKDRVDIKAYTNNNSWHFFELKTDLPKLSVRKALGQILEYACFPDKFKAEKLIIVADREPTEELVLYLNNLRERFSIPISYRHFDLKTNVLSEDY